MYAQSSAKRLNTITRILGFSAIEVLLVVAILALLAAIAVPSYENYRDKKDITMAKEDLLKIQTAIEKYYVLNNRLPESLSDLGLDHMRDPWKTPYYYQNVASAKNKGDVRKDKNLTPVNSDYDLYSAGKNKETKLPFTAKVSRDDIVRCNNGGFIGLVENY